MNDPIQALGHELASAVVAALAVQLRELPLPAVGRAVYSEKALAEELGVTRGTLADWRREGRGPAYVRVGKTLVYPVWAVVAWIDAAPKFSSTAAESNYKRRARVAA